MHTSLFKRSAILAILLISAIGAPFSASAASSKVSCTLTITSSGGKETVREDDDDAGVVVAAGEIVRIDWTSKNAEDAQDTLGRAIDLSGSTTTMAFSSETLNFRFENGRKDAECEVSLLIVTGGFDADSLMASSNKPTITGTASGVKEVRVAITNQENGRKVTTSKELKVKNGKFKFKSTKKMLDGTYDIALLGPKDAGSGQIARSVLTVDTDRSKSSASTKADTTLVVTSVPLLSGGTTRAGASVPIAYLQIVNTGKKTATLTGFTVKQFGTASTDAVMALTTVDDKGGSRGVSAGTKPFASGSAFAPTLPAEFAPGQMRLFTIKANLGPAAASQIGRNLMLDVTGISTNAGVSGSFPIRGTTWAISY